MSNHYLNTILSRTETYEYDFETESLGRDVRVQRVWRCELWQDIIFESTDSQAQHELSVVVFFFINSLSYIMYVHLLAFSLQSTRASQGSQASLAIFPESMIASLLDHTNGDRFIYVNEHGASPTIGWSVERSKYADILTSSLAVCRV